MIKEVSVEELGKMNRFIKPHFEEIGKINCVLKLFDFEHLMKFTNDFINETILELLHIDPADGFPLLHELLREMHSILLFSRANVSVTMMEKSHCTPSNVTTFFLEEKMSSKTFLIEGQLTRCSDIYIVVDSTNMSKYVKRKIIEFKIYLEFQKKVKIIHIPKGRQLEDNNFIMNKLKENTTVFIEY